MTHLNVKYLWIPLESEPGVTYAFPGKRTPLIKTSLARPGVYRWAVLESNSSLAAVYIGESENMFRRWNEYRSPTTKEEQQWNQYLSQEANAGKRVEFHVLDFQPFEINAFAISAGSLIGAFHRKLMENLVLADHVAQGGLVLNKTSDLKAKQEKRDVKDLQRRELKVKELQRAELELEQFRAELKMLKSKTESGK